MKLFLVLLLLPWIAYGQLKNERAPRCIQSGSGIAVPGPLSARPCDGSFAQALVVEGSKLKIGGYCVAPQQGSYANGTRLWLQFCDGSQAQNWTIAHTRYSMASAPGQVIDLHAQNLNDVILWQDYGSSNQRWSRLTVVVPPPPPDAFQVQNARATAKCLQAEDGSPSAGDLMSAKVCNAGSATQTVTFPTNPGGSFRMMIGTLCIGSQSGAFNNGARLQLQMCNGSTNQNFLISAGRFAPANALTQVMDLHGQNNNDVIFWQDYGNTNQRWNQLAIVVPPPPPPPPVPECDLSRPAHTLQGIHDQALSFKNQMLWLVNSVRGGRAQQPGLGRFILRANSESCWSYESDHASPDGSPMSFPFLVRGLQYAAEWRGGAASKLPVPVDTLTKFLLHWELDVPTTPQHPGSRYAALIQLNLIDRDYDTQAKWNASPHGMRGRVAVDFAVNMMLDEGAVAPAYRYFLDLHKTSPRVQVDGKTWAVKSQSHQYISRDAYLRWDLGPPTGDGAIWGSPKNTIDLKALLDKSRQMGLIKPGLHLASIYAGVEVINSKASNPRITTKNFWVSINDEPLGQVNP